MFFIKIYIKESYINYYDTSIQMCGQYCILAPIIPKPNGADFGADFAIFFGLPASSFDHSLSKCH